MKTPHVSAAMLLSELVRAGVRPEDWLVSVVVLEDATVHPTEGAGRCRAGGEGTGNYADIALGSWMAGDQACLECNWSMTHAEETATGAWTRPSALVDLRRVLEELEGTEASAADALALVDAWAHAAELGASSFAEAARNYRNQLRTLTHGPWQGVLEEAVLDAAVDEVVPLGGAAAWELSRTSALVLEARAAARTELIGRRNTWLIEVDPAVAAELVHSGIGAFLEAHTRTSGRVVRASGALRVVLVSASARSDAALVRAEVSVNAREGADEAFLEAVEVLTPSMGLELAVQAVRAL